MKLSTLTALILGCFFSINSSFGQANAAINILTQHAGFVGIGNTVFIEVTVNSTGPTNAITANKLKTQVSVPSAITSIPVSGHTLPAGWSIISNNGSTINLCNGSDVIAAGTSRTILIAIQGNSLGGPLTIGGQLSFSGGTNCVNPGSLAGDNPADNSSQSSIQVYDPVPVTLVDFNAVLQNCIPVLYWTTSTELNSDRFEIERNTQDNTNWVPVGVVAAKGNSSTETDYSFTDRNLNSSSHVFYRLKMIDKDGRYKYSETVRVVADCKVKEVNVYPNPVQRGKLYISLTGAGKYPQASLATASGQVILKSKLNNGSSWLDVSALAAGIYVLHITDESGFDKIVKVVIQQ